MKRFIVILFATVFALVLWNHFSSRKAETKQTSSDVSSKTNSMAERVTARRTPGGALSQNNSTDSPADVEEAAEKKLPREQIEAYLLKTKRSPESLLNAFDETGDTNFLAEAVKNFSDNPMVQFAMLYQETSPEERKDWIDKFKASSPSNALPNFLAAQDYLKAGDVEAALAEMNSANQKANWSSFNADRIQSKEEMYLLSGYPLTEAKGYALNGVSLKVLADLRRLGGQLSELQKSYQTAGDETSVKHIAVMGLRLSVKTKDGNDNHYVVNQLVSAAIETRVLSNLDSGTFYDFLGKTPGERIEELKEQKAETRELVKFFSQTFPKLTETEMLIFSDRAKLYGELNAMRWLKKTYGDEPK